MHIAFEKKKQLEINASYIIHNIVPMYIYIYKLYVYTYMNIVYNIICLTGCMRMLYSVLACLRCVCVRNNDNNWAAVEATITRH